MGYGGTILIPRSPHGEFAYGLHAQMDKQSGNRHWQKAANYKMYGLPAHCPVQKQHDIMQQST